MTTDAPAAKALVISPEYLIPPSAMTEYWNQPKPWHTADCRQLRHPGTDTIRVVQIEPGPTPDFHGVDAGFDQIFGRPGVAIFPQ